MKAPEEIRRELTRRWLYKVKDDLETSRVLIRMGERFAANAAFHANQAAEKYIKTLLVWHQIEPPKSHNLVLLVSLLERIDPRLPKRLQALIPINPYSVTARYPGSEPEPEPTISQARDALEIAESTREAIREALPEEVVSTG